MLHKLILLVSLYAIFGTVSAQDIMSVNWQENITSNSYINKVYDLETDSHGNVLMLGSFPVEANMPGQTLYGSTGEHLLSKQDTSGNLIYGINFGAQSYLAEGELEVSDDDDITIAVNYKGNFYWNDTVLTSSPNFTALVIKLDSALNLLWYVEAPCVKQNFAQLFTEGMVQDESENVYTCIRYMDSIDIDGTIYTNNGTSYGLVLSKFDSLGNHQWTRQYQSEPGSILSDIVVTYHPNSIGVPELIISGFHPSNTLYIDTIPIVLDTQSGAFISKLDINGNILESVRVRNVDYIIDFGFFENRIFFAGMFHDTLQWTGGSTVTINESAFIGELNDTLGIVNFVDLVTNASIHLKGFSISEKFGFVIHGNYHQEQFTVQSSLINLIGSPTNGAFLITFDQGFVLNQAKYVPASYFNFRKICIKDTLIYGAGIFENDLNFANSTDHSWNEDICVLRINDLSYLATFENLSLDDHFDEDRKISLYPNPAKDGLQFSGLQSSNAYQVSIYNLSGKLVMNTTIQQNTVTISDLPSGLYYLKLEGTSFEPLKFVKE